MNRFAYFQSIAMYISGNSIGVSIGYEFAAADIDRTGLFCAGRADV